ncbi:MAG: hypothetical protein M3261_05870, partial [Thermoproteota archaeon]|nr:hypothetical protein [Thermoproteota archaeon]
GSFVAGVPGRHTIVFEVQWGDQPPEYYTYNRLCYKSPFCFKSRPPVTKVRKARPPLCHILGWC